MNIQKTVTLNLLFLATLLTSASSPLDFPGEEAASVGIVIRDLTTGKEIVNHNGGKTMTPASTMKLVTTAAALTTVGGDYRYKTPVYVQGTIDSGRVIGNIVVDASGDPTLYSCHFDENATLADRVVESLRRSGVSSIAGEIIINDLDMKDQGQVPTWEIEDAAYGYGAGYYALNFSDNTFKLRTADDMTDPEQPEIETVIEQKGKEMSITHGINSNLYVITGPKVFLPSTRVTLPMNYPADAFALFLEKKITASGIAFTEPETCQQVDSIALACNLSPRSGDIMRSLLVRSDNMMAESTLRLLAPGKTLKDAIEAEKSFLDSVGLDTRYADIRDGSGLTRSNGVQPMFLADLLTFMAKGRHCDEYVSMLPRSGVDGTMKNFLAGTRLSGRVAMKTGSMSGVRCYAGYLLDRGGRPTHVIVVMVNHFNCNSTQVKKSIEKFLLNNLK